MATPSLLTFGRFRLDMARRVLLDGESPVRLGSRAMDLLAVLAGNADRVVGKSELFELVWPGLVVEENNLQQHISALRRVLGPEAIVTVPGRGYKFAPPRADAQGSGATAPSEERAGDAMPGPAQLHGREDELAQLRARIVAHDLVTVVGPGGVGKTRLAWTAARADEAAWSGGVWIVDLAVVDDAARVPAAVADALGVVPSAAAGADPSAALASALRKQHLLLVLDNCEHVLEGAARVIVALRRQAPGVHVLATSQEPLGLPGEQLLRLAPLGPAAAVQLFVARATAADWRFAPTAGELAEIAFICDRLEGLPLAIELAAARLPLLGLQGLRERLKDSLQLLATPGPRAPARQQALRGALDWSHGLLSVAEQLLFRRLSVFTGGFSLELAERVLAGEGVEPWELLDRLGSLIDKSLVISDHQPVIRCRLLEPARAYALEKLQAAGEEPALRLRHARALVALLQALDAAVVRETRHDLLLQPMLAERPNLSAAMRWLADAGAGSITEPGLGPAEARRLAIELAACADWLWAEGDAQGDGFRFCALARSWLDDSVAPALACRLRLAYQAQARARWLPAADWIEDARTALSACRALGDTVGRYRALCALGRAPRTLIGEDEAGALLAEAAQIEDAAWSPRLRMHRQVSLEWWHDLGNRMEACREAGQRCLALAREAGSVRNEIGALGNLADTESALGRMDEAIALSRRAIALASAHHMPAAAVHAYSNMVPALLASGHGSDAEQAIVAGQQLMVRTCGTALELLWPAALLVWQRGDQRLAARLVGCADRAYRERGEDPHPPERRMRDTVLAGLRAALAATEVSALMQEGARWAEDEGFEQAGLRAALSPPP